MNCLHGLTISFAPPLQSAMKQSSRVAPLNLGILRADQRRKFTIHVHSSSAPETDKVVEDGEQKEKSEIYSNDMTQAMGAVLTYRHELGMNYNFVCPDLIVGSCLQTPSDVDTLRRIGVRTIYCLQQDSDLEYFGVDIGAIQEYTMKFDDIEHLRAEIRDFDAFDLRMRLPAVVSKLHKAINRNGGITYIHCTAGLGRAPAVALAYMFWIKGYSLNEGLKQILSNRSCFPKIDAIKSATADILTGMSKSRVTLTWEGNEFSTVEVSGLDIGWGQRIPLQQFNKEQGIWTLDRELPDGVYEYKYIVDGEWICNENELLTSPNNDGHVNNYVQISSNHTNERDKEIRERLTGEYVDLTKEEREMISELLKQYDD